MHAVHQHADDAFPQGVAQPLCGAAWSPDSKAMLVANAGSRQLVALYFTQQPPGMEAQTFPIALPLSGMDAVCMCRDYLRCPGPTFQLFLSKPSGCPNMSGRILSGCLRCPSGEKSQERSRF